MKKVHLICNAHIDPIWQWDWQEGASATLSTFRCAADLADEFDYIFCHNEVTVYKYIEEYAPALFQRIKDLVQAGKWRIMGGWYLQPDCNMPSGESFTRQILKGKEYFTEKFGVFPTAAVNFDPFGHTKGLVQIIQKCGQDSYLFMRPWPQELALPSNQFHWQGFAGSRIKANRVRAYASALGQAAQAIQERAANQPQDVVCVTWGVGNHGGGPSRKDLADIRELMENSEIEYVHSSPEQFFSEMRTRATWDKSIQISNPGCYTSMLKVKQAHIALEKELYLAEKLCATAASAGLMDYPGEKFGEITEDLLNAEFHDTLPGTCIRSGEQNALNLLGHGMLEAERLKTRGFFALSNEQDQAAEGEYPILVFNSQPYDVEENIECEFILADQNWNDTIRAAIELLDEDGNAVPYQQIKEESNLNLDWRKRIIFKAKLKAMEMSRYSVYIHFEPAKAKEITRAFAYDDGHKYVEVDPETGLLTHYRLDGVEYIGKGFGLVMCDDNADPWAMGKSQLEAVGTDPVPFALETVPGGPFRGLRSIQVTDNGPIYLGIEAFFVSGNTRARIGYKIYKNDDAVDIDVHVFLQDMDKMVKLRVPMATQGHLVGQTAFGEDALFTDGRENVSHRYVCLQRPGSSLGLLNNCLYGSSFRENVLYLSLVRGVTYCAHPIEDRPLIPGDRYVKKPDQGESSFSFRLIAAPAEQMGQLAQRFNQKPFAINAYPLNKVETKPLRASAVKLDNTAVTLEAFKGADQGQGYILRLLNNTARSQTAILQVRGTQMELAFADHEVKTVVFRDGVLTESAQLLI